MLLGEAASQQRERSIPKLLAENRIGAFEDGVNIFNVRLLRPYILGTWVGSFTHTKAGFRDYLSGVGHSEFFEDVDFHKLDMTFDSIAFYRKLNFPYVIFGSTGVVAADATAEMPDVEVGKIRREYISFGKKEVMAEISHFNKRDKLLIQFRPNSVEYFDITPLYVGSPFHGYTQRPTEFTPLVSVAISSAGVDYIHPDGSLGVVAGPIVQLFDLATQYTYDNPETQLPKSKIWSLLKNEDLLADDVDGRTGDRVVKSDVDIVLSDGGHSDKLGIVPLLWRDCREIIALDMGEDPNQTFADEVHLVRQVNSDPYVEGTLHWNFPNLLEKIDSDGGTMYLCRQEDLSCNEPTSEVKVIKLAFRGCEGEDIGDEKRREYSLNHLCNRYDGDLRGTFPHESVQILQYDRERVMAYEELGKWLATKHSADIARMLRAGFRSRPTGS